jgi:hypothetical protein
MTSWVREERGRLVSELRAEPAAECDAQRCPLCNVTAIVSRPAEPDFGTVFACKYHGEFFEVDEPMCGWKFVDGWPYPSKPEQQANPIQARAAVVAEAAVAGAEAGVASVRLEDAPAWIPRSEWIPCSERMPDTDTRVHIVYASFGGPRVIIAVLETEEQNGEADGWRADGGGWYAKEWVAHWTPLPAPPVTR